MAKHIYRVRYEGSGTAKGEFREVLTEPVESAEHAQAMADQRLVENHPLVRDDAHATQLALEALGSAGVAEPTKEQIAARAELFRQTPQIRYKLKSVEKA